MIPVSLDEWSDHFLKSFGEVSLEEVWSPFKAMGWLTTSFE
jgi:hypothetical protein